MLLLSVDLKGTQNELGNSNPFSWENEMKKTLRCFVVLVVAIAGSAGADPAYHDGLSPLTVGYTFGDHQVGGSHASVAGVGGGGISNAGDALNGQRTYIWDKGAQADLTDGVANRGDAGFAMLIWDMGTAFNSMRLFTHQDHYGGGPITTDYVAQDVMEYSVWGSQDGDDFVLLSDVTAFDLTGGGAGKPTYTFAGTAPTDVYRGGSSEFDAVNAYTRDYVFGAAYQYYGIRTSQISLTIPGGGVDADPEIDAIAGFHTPVVPVPGSFLLGSIGLGYAGWIRRRRAIRE